MTIRTTALLLTVVLSLASCLKDSETDDVIQLKVLDNPTATTIPVSADGTTQVTLLVSIPENADTDKREVVLEATGGLLKGSEDGKLTKTITKLGAEEGKLSEEITYIAPSSPGNYTISAYLQGYLATLEVVASESVATSISVKIDSFSTIGNYAKTVVVSATVKNALGKPASQGVSVNFSDNLAPSPLSRFKPSTTYTNAQGIATTVYTPGINAANQYVTITGNIQGTAIADTAAIYVYEP